MIAVDTNVLVRYLVRDDAAQAEAARELLEDLSVERPGFICREVMVEVVWVLDRAYGFARGQIATVVDGLVTTASLVVEEATRWRRLPHATGLAAPLRRSDDPCRGRSKRGTPGSTPSTGGCRGWTGLHS